MRFLVSGSLLSINTMLALKSERGNAFVSPALSLISLVKYSIWGTDFVVRIYHSKEMDKIRKIAIVIIFYPKPQGSVIETITETRNSTQTWLVLSPQIH